MAQIARVCLNGNEGLNTAKKICQHLVKAITDNHIYTFDYPDLLDSLTSAQPFVFLDVYFGNEEIEDYQRRRMLSVNFGRRNNPLNQISENNLISWCDNDPEDRYPLIVSAIQAFSESTQTGRLAWKPIVYSIFEKAPDLGVVFEHLVDAIWPTSWNSSLADILQRRSVLFQQLDQNDNEEISAWARYQYSAFQEKLERERECEQRQSHKRNESFE